MSVLNEIEQRLNEKLTSELGYLKRYLQMSDQEMAVQRAYANSYLIDDFLEEHDLVDDFLKLSKTKELEDMDYPEKVEWLDQYDKAMLVSFGDWIVDQPAYFESGEQELYDIATYEGLVRNEWLAHFTDHAGDIWRSQRFKYGTPHEDYQRLGLSTFFTGKTKERGGWNFAYRARDLDPSREERYGSEAILFLGNGVMIYHHGDNEPQVIFDGSAIDSPLIYVTSIHDGDKKWGIESTKTGKLLRQADTVKELAQWVADNYAQYRNHLEP